MAAARVAALDVKIAELQAARAARDFAQADAIRQQLTERNVVLEDTQTGPRWRVAT